ncbi:MAG: redoxin domain-containing protein [Planctomycetota bacterium]
MTSTHPLLFVRAAGPLLVLALSAAPCGRVASALEVGDAAVPVAPSEWINAPPGFAWNQLEGRLVLVEKWATWCGPCRQTIPHLNELFHKYEKKGLTIIGVSDEAAGVVKSFLQKVEMQYTIAIGGADEYKTASIPHAWLVSPERKIVWKGHPSGLQDSLIEEHLKTVSLSPRFALPPELKAAEKQLNSGNYAAGLKALEAHLKNPKNAETETAAKEAIEKAKKYGEDRLAKAEDYGKARAYPEGAAILAEVEKCWKGTELGNRARDLLQEWRRDKTIKLELHGAAIIEKADSLAQAKKYRDAAGLLLALTKGKKFEGTRVREIAEEKLAKLERKL